MRPTLALALMIILSLPFAACSTGLTDKELPSEPDATASESQPPGDSEAEHPHDLLVDRGHDRGRDGSADERVDQKIDEGKDMGPRCGDKHKDTGEDCDGDDFGTTTCKSLNFAGGALACNANCTIDTHQCTTCGNQHKDTGEDCDGNDFGTTTCVTLGHGEGHLACNANCTIDTSACAATTGVIIISEFMPDPSAVFDTKGEWIELFNGDSVPIDLYGWTLADLGTDTHVITDHLVIPSGAYIVLGINADKSTNGHVDVAYSYGGGWHLGNTDDEIILSDPQKKEIDRVVYTKAWFTSGASVSVLDLKKDNGVKTNWCQEPTPWSGSAGDKGSPGKATDCPVP